MGQDQRTSQHAPHLVDAGHVASQLLRLQAADLIRPTPSREDSDYSFRHGLIQETAYESLLRSARSQLHERVAVVIETLADGEVAQHAAVLAEHYDRAGRVAKAFHYLVIAGENASRQYAHEEALSFYDRALALKAAAPDASPADQVQVLYAGRGRVLEVSGDHEAAEANYQAMLNHAQSIGNEAMQADALNRLVTVQVVYRRGPDLRENLERALALSRRVGDPILVGRALWNEGLALRFYEPRSAVGKWQEALRLVQESEVPAAQRLAASLILDLVVGTAVSGRLREARAYAHQAIQAFREQGNRQMVADALGGAALVAHVRGEVAEAEALAAEGLHTSEEIGNPWGIIYNEWTGLAVELDAGRLESVLHAAERRLPAAQQLGFPVFEGRVTSLAAKTCLELGAWSRGLALATESHQIFDRIGGPIWPMWGAGVLGQARVATGDVEGAGALLEPLWTPGTVAGGAMQGYLVAGPAIGSWALAAGRLDHGERFCSWLIDAYEAEEGWRLVGEMQYLRGRIYLAKGDLSAAEPDLQRARSLLAAAQVRILLWCVDAALAGVWSARGEGERAADHRQRALDQVRGIADRIDDPELRASFLARGDVRELLA